MTFRVLRNHDHKTIKQFDDVDEAQRLAENLMDRNHLCYSVVDEDNSPIVTYDPNHVGIIKKYKIRPRKISERTIKKFVNILETVDAKLD